MADFLATVLAKVAVLLIERLVVQLSQAIFTSALPSPAQRLETA